MLKKPLCIIAKRYIVLSYATTFENIFIFAQNKNAKQNIYLP